jgi:flagellar basal body-associated protein FliL
MTDNNDKGPSFTELLDAYERLDRAAASSKRQTTLMIVSIVTTTVILALAMILFFMADADATRRCEAKGYDKEACAWR